MNIYFKIGPTMKYQSQVHNKMHMARCSSGSSRCLQSSRKLFRPSYSGRTRTSKLKGLYGSWTMWIVTGSWLHFISRSNIFGFLINKRNTELKWTGRWIRPWKKQVDRAAKNLVRSEMLVETDVNQERRIGTAEAAFTFLSETENFSYLGSHMQKFSNRGRLEPGTR